MKKLSLKLLACLCLSILSFSAFALEDACNPTDPYLAWGQADVNFIIADFANNCCAGSVISVFDMDSMTIQYYTTQNHGRNSGCATIYGAE